MRRKKKLKIRSGRRVASLDKTPRKEARVYNRHPDVRQDPPLPQLLKRDVRDIIKILDKTFRFVGQEPPKIHAYSAHPAQRFLMDVMEKLTLWKHATLRRFIEEVSNVDPQTFEHIEGMWGEMKRILSEVFWVDYEYGDEVPLTKRRWSLWPHRYNTKEEFEVEVKANQEKDVAGKKATAKKKGSDKIEPKKGKGKKTSKVSLTETTKLVIVKDSKTPKNPKRAKIKKAIGAGLTVAAAMKETSCTIATLEAMVKKGFIKAA